MNKRQLQRIERFLRLEVQLQLDNVLFELRASIIEGRTLNSADLILLSSNLQRLRSAGADVLEILDAERDAIDVGSHSRLGLLEVTG